MSAPVDVMEVFARAERQARMVAGLAGDPRARQLLKDLSAARDAFAELIEVAEMASTIAGLHISLDDDGPCRCSQCKLVMKATAALASVRGSAA